MNTLVATLKWPASVARHLRWRSLAEAYESRVDNFLLLRFVASSILIYAHSYAVSGIPSRGDIFLRNGWNTHAGKIAVELFFCISGFLVTASLVRWQNTLAFLKARALRLLPAYIVCMAISAYVIGPLVTTLPLGEYMRHPLTHSYVVANLEMRQLQWILPGVEFSNSAYHNAVNGSIWSLPLEATMYLWLATLGLLGVYRRTWFATCTVLALAMVCAKYWAAMPLLSANHDPQHLPYAAMFALGSLAYLHRRFIPLGHAGMLACVAFAWATHYGVLAGASMLLAQSYFCFWFAYCLPWHGFNRFGDYSYGIYLWGFPCQQLIVLWLGHPRPARITLLALPLALLFAIASWHLIEHPALRLKKWPILKLRFVNREGQREPI